jgi:hypothetical protein
MYQQYTSEIANDNIQQQYEALPAKAKNNYAVVEEDREETSLSK